jgi:hypothetical protein
VIIDEGIAHYRVRGHILIKKSDADNWRELHRVEPVEQRHDLKTMLKRISEGVLAKRRAS